MFQGFTDETFAFFMAIRFNNNRDFFHENHDWYVRALRGPCLELVQALSPAALALDGQFDTRPDKVVSRINRDLRFSHDKTPYRDYIWLHFRRAGADKGSSMGAYFDMGVENARCGVGMYDENRPMMNALRRKLRQEPDAFLAALPEGDDIQARLNTFKRMAVPEGIPQELAQWYVAKGFYFEMLLKDFNVIKSAALVEAISDCYRRLQPLYHYFNQLTPEPDSDASEAQAKAADTDTREATIEKEV